MICLSLEDLRFSWWWCWRFKSSGIWCCVIGWVVHDVWKDCTAFILRFLQNKNSYSGEKVGPSSHCFPWWAGHCFQPPSINSYPCMTPTSVSCAVAFLQLLHPEDKSHYSPSEYQELLAHWHSLASLKTWIFCELTCLLSYSWKQLMRRASCWWVKWMDKSLTVMMSCWGCEESAVCISLITVSSLWIVLSCVHKTATRGFSSVVCC
jgi:hypothetical protein